MAIQQRHFGQQTRLKRDENPLSFSLDFTDFGKDDDAEFAKCLLRITGKEEASFDELQPMLVQLQTQSQQMKVAQ